LLTLSATDASLKVMGKNDTIVKKIFGNEATSLVEGIPLGDLHQDNIRKILCEIDCSPRGNECGSHEVLTYELTYLPYNGHEKVNLKGVLSLIYTDDSTLIPSDVHPDVRVNRVIQEAGESDKEIATLVKLCKIEEAKQKQKEQLTSLKSVLEHDKSGMVSMLISISETSEKKLEEQGASKDVEQSYSHGGYTKNRGCYRYMETYS